MASKPAAPVPSTAATPSPSSLPTNPTSTAPTLSPASLDAFLTHLHRCLQTPSGIDTVLQFTCFTSRLAAAVLASTSNHILARSARHLVALALALPPRSTLLFTSSSSSASAPGAATAGAAATLVLARRLKALSGLLSEARMITRLWALLGMYFWAKRLLAQISALLSSSSSSSDEKATSTRPTAAAAATLVSALQLAACIVFQSLENVAFLSAKGVLGLTPLQQVKAGRWSARFWGLFVGMEIGRLASELYAKGAERGHASVEEREKESGEVATMQKAVVRNLAWAPLTVHWGSEVGFIPEMGVAAIACVPSVLGMRDLWRSTAQ